MLAVKFTRYLHVLLVKLVPRLFPLPRETGHMVPTFWELTNEINMEDVLKINFCSYLAKCREENILISSKQRRMHINLFCLFPCESGCHVTRSNQGLSLGIGKGLGTRLGTFTSTTGPGLYLFSIP